MTSSTRNTGTEKDYEHEVQTWARLVAPRMNAGQRKSLAALIRRMVREATNAAAEPEAKGWPVNAAKGEWRCRCEPDPKYDTSINPSYFVRCTKCGAERPTP
jgi:hypothetical protein